MCATTEETTTTERFTASPTPTCDKCSPYRDLVELVDPDKYWHHSQAIHAFGERADFVSSTAEGVHRGLRYSSWCSVTKSDLEQLRIERATTSW